MKEEREINLIDVLFDCLLHWRGIILFMLIGAVLAGAGGFAKSYLDSGSSIEMAKTFTESDPSILLENNKDFKQQEIATIKQTLSQKEYLKRYEDYADFFSYENWDYTNVPNVEYIYAVKADDYKSAQNLVNKYRFYATSDEFIEYLKENTSLDTRFINECYSVTMQDGSGADVMGEEFQGADSVCMFKIHAYYMDEEGAKILGSALNDFIIAKSKSLNNEVSKHSLISMGESFSYKYDMGILNKLKSVEDNINNNLINMGKNIDNFSAEGKSYYETVTQEEAAQEALANGEPVAVDEETGEELYVPLDQRTAEGSISKKFILVGAVLFPCLYIGIIIVLKYVFNAKLKRGDDLSEIYKTPVLGKISTVNDKKRFLGFIDKWIIAIRDRNKRSFTKEEALDLSASSVKIAAKKNDFSEIIAIGCNMTKINDVSSKLYEKLSGENIKVEELDNILYNPETLGKLAGKKGAVIIEQIGNTLYEELEKEIEILNSQDIKLLGIITVE